MKIESAKNVKMKIVFLAVLSQRSAKIAETVGSFMKENVLMIAQVDGLQIQWMFVKNAHLIIVKNVKTIIMKLA